MTEACLVLLVRRNRILLARKKRGFGAGKLNGPGGKLEIGETFEEAAIRETHEEIGVRVGPMVEVARLQFHMDGYDGHKMKNLLGVVFLCMQWKGEAIESDEMAPQWFDLEKIPYGEMWSDDIYWLPEVLAGNYVDGEFWFGLDDTVRKKNIIVRSRTASI